MFPGLHVLMTLSSVRVYYFFSHPWVGSQEEDNVQCISLLLKHHNTFGLLCKVKDSSASMMQRDMNTRLDQLEIHTANSIIITPVVCVHLQAISF